MIPFPLARSGPQNNVRTTRYDSPPPAARRGPAGAAGGRGHHRPDRQARFSRHSPRLRQTIQDQLGRHPGYAQRLRSPGAGRAGADRICRRAARARSARRRRAGPAQRCDGLHDIDVDAGADRDAERGEHDLCGLAAGKGTSAKGLRATRADRRLDSRRPADRSDGTGPLSAVATQRLRCDDRYPAAGVQGHDPVTGRQRAAHRAGHGPRGRLDRDAAVRRGWRRGRCAAPYRQGAKLGQDDHHDPDAPVNHGLVQELAGHVAIRRPADQARDFYRRVVDPFPDARRS